MNLINTSWLDLKPNENEDGNQEWFEEYYSRIKNKVEYVNFPKEVFEQWIHPHHKNFETLKNYAWIDFEKVYFELTEWTFNELKDIYIIEDYRQCVEERSSYSKLNQFCCTKTDLKFWNENGTWKTPPIILDNQLFLGDKPEWSELKGEYQLVEGHQRFGYLNSMKRITEIGKLTLAEKHKIYLIKKYNCTTPYKNNC